MSEANSGNSKT
jgi:hypothetical protein